MQVLETLKNSGKDLYPEDLAFFEAELDTGDYERNPKARARCIAVHGSACKVCGFDFGIIFGEEFSGKIEVHHIKPISEIGEEYMVDPVHDLVPVCPNCHMMLHSSLSLHSNQAFLCFGITPGPQFRENSRARGARSLRFQRQRFDPPFPSAEQSEKVDLASWTSTWQSRKVDLREPEGNGDTEFG